MRKLFSTIVSFPTMTTLWVLLYSSMSLAHSGHGDTTSVFHEMHHLLWLVGTLSLLAVAAFVVRKKL